MKDLSSTYEAYTILLSPRFIIGAWLERKESSGAIRLVSMHHKKLRHLELERLILFNPTAIGKLIKTWYRNCHQEMPLLFALHGPAIEEHVVSLHSAHPTLSQLPIAHAHIDTGNTATFIHLITVTAFMCVVYRKVYFFNINF